MSMQNTQPDWEQRVEEKREQAALDGARRAAMQAASSRMQERVQNPNFLSELQEPKIDTDAYDWVEDEFPAAFAGARILGNRGEDHEHRREWLNQNAARRYIAANSPGRILREHPSMLKIAQNPHPDLVEDEDIDEPLQPDERRVVHGAHEVATDRQSMSVEGHGVDAVSTATAEARTVTNESEEETESGFKGKLKRFYG